MVDPPLVTVNILAHNRRHQLERSLRTMREQLAYPSESLEWIVVDNASSDGTAEMLASEFPEVRVIANPNVGAAGWTRGFQEGRGDWFLTLDDDCFLTGEALERAVRSALEHDADLVSFRVVSSEDPGFEFSSHYRVGLLSFWASAALVSRRAVEALDGFDPEIFIWANELEFTIRLLDRGFRHLFLSEVTAVHMQPPREGIEAGAYATHMRHLAYVAAKLLRRREMLVVLANLTAKAWLDILRAPSRWRALPGLAAGARRGLRRREPVRAPVSRLYRRNFREFTSPLFYVGPYLRGRHDDFYTARPELYPTGTASLAL